MVGRAAVRHPWIFAQAKNEEINHGVHGVSRSEENPTPCALPPLADIGLRFIELLSKHQPPEFYISRARRFFGFFCDNLKWGTYLKNQLNREQTLSGVENVWRKYFRENEG